MIRQPRTRPRKLPHNATATVRYPDVTVLVDIKPVRHTRTHVIVQNPAIRDSAELFVEVPRDQLTWDGVDQVKGAPVGAPAEPV